MTEPDHLVSERQTLILTELHTKGRVLAQKLARDFGVSEDTVRRDLREMAARGECERVYGGALLPRGTTRPLAERIAEAPTRKALLGAAAASLIEDGMVVFFDAGSTNLAVVRSLPAGMRITAVTNTPALAAELTMRPETQLIVIGGKIDPVVGAAIDTTALRQLDQIRPDLCLIGACGMTADHGLAADVYEDAVFKRMACAAARRTLAAATNEKLTHAAAFQVMPLSAALTVVVEADADAATTAAIAACGPTIVRAVATENPIQRQNR
ncbi:transcriptional regulator, DeoR family [Rhizobium sp. RU20A]|uniref:DeoR/GlpR family DNA-binding transcription regulator n=1 Tax=Rhizobium sp. RU20A TaxID=1907412 RepID=UPI000956805E|nr:DeoR/GlpR family DNA-binding transcription regulator [Rhizobium sp. RU20A]SIR40639.1 transcriptional regulator, DeoR family [Rhizobium sp. RU20A]